MKEIKHLEKVDRKYVIASVDDAAYLVYKNDKYSFVKNISYATKFTNRDIAKKYIKFYAIDTLDNEYKLIVLPLIIEYSLLEEVDLNG